jgi:LmbE family N-acetylglucosaminyl deacetylase
VKPDNIYVTAFEGGHPDHDCANFVVFEARRRTGIAFNILEFPLYNGAGSALTWRWKINDFPNEDGMELKLPLTSREIAIRYRVMRTYSSQFLYMIPARLASSTVRMLKQGEPQRLCNNSRDHTVKPHPGKLNYERWFNMFMRIKFDDYRQAVEKAILTK